MKMAYIVSYTEKGKRRYGGRVFKSKKAARSALMGARKGIPKKMLKSSRYKNIRIRKI